MTGIGARDETEGMLATQMIATHFAAISALRRLKGSETVPQQDSNGNLAIKLLRTFTMQVEALHRYRGKGQQKGHGRARPRQRRRSGYRRYRAPAGREEEMEGT